MSDQPQYVEDDEFDYSEAFERPATRGRAIAAPVPRPRRTDQARGAYAVGVDLYLVLVTAALCAVGLLMVYSASIDVSYQVTGDSSNTTYFFIRQARSMVVGIIIAVILARIDYHIWRGLAVPMMLGVILLLVAVLQFGEERFEAQRALISGSLQPGELAKFTVVLYMAAWLAAKRARLRNIFYGILPFSVLVGTIAFLIVLQPDLSTAASILATSLSMFFIAGADLLQLIFIGGVMGVTGWQMIMRFQYARDRLENYWKQVEDLTQASDHVQQAVAAFINGELFGVGLGESELKFANNLPFPHTDSIFAIIGEELGLFGAFGVIVLYVVLFHRGFVIARHAPDAFGGLLAAGVTCWLAYDAMLNIAVMTALVPPTGVPLPFISFGGSSLVAALAGVGLMINVSRQISQQANQQRPGAHLNGDVGRGR